MTFPKVVSSHNEMKPYHSHTLTSKNPSLTSAFQYLVITVHTELEYFLCRPGAQLFIFRENYTSF